MLEDLLGDNNDLSGIIKILDAYGFKYKMVKDIISVKIGKNIFIIDDFSYPDLKEGNEWVWGLSDTDLKHYIPSQDFNKEFWNSPFTIYHATNLDNLDNIKKHGLLMRDETRGISNRSTGSAVFTSVNPYSIEAYGDLVLEINANQMKIDGFTPNVSKEESIEVAEQRETLANLIGLGNDFYDGLSSEGIYSDTIVFYSNIPPKYIKVYR